MYLIFSTIPKYYIPKLFSSFKEAKKWLLNSNLTFPTAAYEIHETKRVASIKETKKFTFILD